MRTSDRVRGVIMRTWPVRFEMDDLADEIALGDEGLGLDSVEIAELLLSCEDESGRSMPDGLLADGALTIARIAGCFWDAT